MFILSFCIFQARNKPIEPPKKPEKAPFFLPSIPSLSGEIVFKASEPTEENGIQDDQSDKIIRNRELPASPFVQFIQSSVETKNCKFLVYLFCLRDDIIGEVVCF